MSDQITEIEKIVKQVGTIAETVLTPERFQKFEKLMEQLGELYFTAPASSKTQYHYAFDGGLAKHSLNVYKNLLKLNATFKCNFSDEAMFVVSVLHDFGKCATTQNGPHYVPTEEDWQRKKGYLYQSAPDAVYFPNHQRSMFLLQKVGFDLTAEEYQAILLNDGQYLESNKAYSMKECKLALFLHIADRLACQLESEESQ